MSAETSSPSRPGTPGWRPFLRPVTLWLTVCGAAMAVVGFGLGWVAESVPAVSADRAAAVLANTAEASSTAYPRPDFRLPSLDGTLLGPADYLGDVVVIDLWATWCGPCRLQARYLEQLHSEYATGVQFLAIDTGEDEATVRRYVEKTPFSYPVLLDPKQSVQTLYKASGLPTVMIIDVTGQVTYLNVGISDPATLRREIERAKQTPEVPAAAGQPAV